VQFHLILIHRCKKLKFKKKNAVNLLAGFTCLYVGDPGRPSNLAIHADRVYSSSQAPGYGNDKMAVVDGVTFVTGLWDMCFRSATYDPMPYWRVVLERRAWVQYVILHNSQRAGGLKRVYRVDVVALQ
jgi:hypothetical protein